MADTQTAVEKAKEWFGVEPYDSLSAIGHAAGILDVVKQEWGEAWTEHDQKTRAGLSVLLQAAPPVAMSTPTEEMIDSHKLGMCLRFACGETCIGCGDSENGIPLSTPTEPVAGEARTAAELPSKEKVMDLMKNAGITWGQAHSVFAYFSALRDDNKEAKHG